ncbi:MAG: YegS/Rv2252/BmrU family lipid kinase [Oscillochloris sp.]|nr:YegS/Rv2252/BmrU family lipid kinase [Oscillochloris sp.]
MNTDQKAQQAKRRALAQAQRQQRQQLKKAEVARAQLNKATQKLSTIEATITRLVQSEQPAKPPLSEQAAAKTAEDRQALVIFNPKSKGAIDGNYSSKQILACLRSYGIVGELATKTSCKDVRKLAKAAAKRGVDLVIAVGGDGTIEEVAGQLIGSSTTLGIIPLGTMNNLARSLGVPLSLDDSCALLRTGLSRHIDVGRVITADNPDGVYFLEMAGVGLSAHALNFGEGFMKGQWVKLLEALGNAFASNIDTVTVAYDDEAPLQVRTHVVTIVNSPLFAGNMFIGPDAKMDDGVLDVALYGDMSKIDLQHHFRMIAAGKRVDDPRITFRRVRRIRVSSSAALAANADLEVFAPQQVWEISIVPAALSVIVGNGIGLTLPVESAMVVPPLTGPQPIRATANGVVG